MDKTQISEVERGILGLASSVYGVGAQDLGKLLASYSLEKWPKLKQKQLLQAGLSELKAQKIYQVFQTDLETWLVQLQSHQIQIVTSFDHNFPKRLTTVDSCPYVLFVRGSIEILNQPSIAIVGTRKPTSYGVQVTRQLATELSVAGLVVVSGLAYGVDAVAHQAVVHRQGTTVGVLGNGIDTIQPRSNLRLGKEMLERGTIVSEYAPGIPALVQNFPARNRLVAGMTLGTVVIEGGEESGSLITAEFAREYQKPIFAVPGMISNPMSLGPHLLLRQGAILVRNTQDILDHLGIIGSLDTRKNQIDRSDLNYVQIQIINLLEQENYSADQLARHLKLPAAEITANLTLLELENCIEDAGQGFFKLMS